MGRLRATATGVAVATIAALVGVAAPQAASAEDAMCRTAQGSNDFYPGPSASTTYDSLFKQSVPIPAGLLDGHYIPQGLAYWNNWNGTTEDILLISAYKDGSPSGIWGVVLSGTRRGDSLGRILVPEGHVGGLAIAGGRVFHSSGGGVRGLSASTVRSVLAGANTNTVYYGAFKDTAGKASFLGTQGSYLWTGDFSTDSPQSMWQYRISSTGEPIYTGVKRTVPKKTQGMATVGNRFVFGTSYGRNDRSNIWVRSTATTGGITDSNSFCMRAPSMIEGLARGNSNGNDHVWALFESGAYEYNKGLDDPDNPIKHIHYASASALAALYGQSD